MHSKVTNCEVTRDPELFDTSDLVLFHGFNLINRDNGTNKYPTHRPEGQRWVFAYYESPMSMRDLCYKNLNNRFHLTNTYHSESDYNAIYYSNAHFEWKTNYSFDPSYNYHSKKVLSK